MQTGRNRAHQAVVGSLCLAIVTYRNISTEIVQERLRDVPRVLKPDTIVVRVRRRSSSSPSVLVRVRRTSSQNTYLLKENCRDHLLTLIVRHDQRP